MMTAIASKDDANSKTSALIVAVGNDGKILFTSISNSAWIIHFGASDYMSFE